MKKGISSAYFALLFFAGAAVAGQWGSVAEKIGRELGGAVKLYEKGDTQGAEEKTVDAYFSVFEGEKANMEIAVRKSLSLKRASELEKGFSDIRKALHNKAPVHEVKTRTLALMDAVKKAADELDRSGVGFNAGP